MTRKSFALRRVRFNPPDEQTAAKYLLVWHARDLYHAQETFPRISSEQLFGDTRPLEMEIGCGTGEYLCSLAAREAAANFLGIDISLKALYAAVENARSLPLGNIKFIKAGMQMVYPLLVPDSLRAVYLHFPDPCLRPKYRKRRIFNATFLDHIHNALVEGGRLSVMTDVPGLFMDMLALIEQDPRFEKTHAERYLEGSDMKSRYQTTWERYNVQPLRFEVTKVGSRG